MVSLEILNKNETVDIKSGQVVLKTCNRTEVYSGGGTIPNQIIKHLFRVTTGLESSLIGEKAIQGQVKDSYQYAITNGLTPSLHKLFQRALYVGKKIRSNTGINNGAISHSQAAVDLLINLNLDIKNSHITLIGAHNLNDKILYYLKKKGAETLFLGNRTYEKAKKLAEKYDSKVFNMDNLKEILEKTDILITATSAPHPIIHLVNFPLNKMMTIIDLAVPCDTDADVQQLKNVKYISNSGVEKTVTRNLKNRGIELIKAEKIVETEVELFLNKLDRDRNRKYE